MPASRADLIALSRDQLGSPRPLSSIRRSSPSEQSQALRGEIPGGHTKNLFLKDKKDRVFLVVAEEDAEIDMKGLHQRIGSARLSFGKPELLGELLGRDPRLGDALRRHQRYRQAA